MPENHLFEYAVIRVVPRVERGEFINAGVAVFCKPKGFLQVKIQLDEARLLALFPQAPIEEIRAHLASFEAIALGKATDSPIARLDLASRFRWLTAKRSTIIQASEVHPGLCSTPDATLERLFRQLVEV